MLIGVFFVDVILVCIYFLNLDKIKYGYSLYVNYSVNLFFIKMNLILVVYCYFLENFYILRDVIWVNSNKLVDDENF